MPAWHDAGWWLWTAAMAVLALAAGYGWGWRRGLRHGRRLERSAAPLWLRAEALERGVCPVCDHVTAREHAAQGPSANNGRAVPPLAQRQGQLGPP